MSIAGCSKYDRLVGQVSNANKLTSTSSEDVFSEKDALLVKNRFTVNQTAISANESISIIRSTDDILSSSDICIVHTEERPHQFTYGANPGLWFSMVLNSTSIMRRFNGREEAASISAYDISVVGPDTPLDMNLLMSTQALHVFLKQDIVDEVAQELYNVNDNQIKIRPVYAKHDSSLSMLMRVINATLVKPTIFGQSQTRSLTRALVVDFLSKYVDSCTESLFKYSNDRLKPSQLRRVLEYIHENLANDIVINCLAVVAGVSRTNFIRRFKGSMHQTPARYIHLLRIRQARELLLKQDMPLSQVAELCGFADSAHLSVAFKREVGVAPSLFRREYG